MITEKQGIAYATITLDLLYKMKVKVNHKNFSEQMKLIYDLYEPNEVEELYENIERNNEIIEKAISGRANCYVVNSYNSREKQMKIIRKFCEDRIELGKIYISTPGENTDAYYKLIQDIRNKSMDILLMNVFTILGMSERELAMIIHLCRENDITFVEI